MGIIFFNVTELSVQRGGFQCYAVEWKAELKTSISILCMTIVVY